MFIAPSSVALVTNSFLLLLVRHLLLVAMHLFKEIMTFFNSTLFQKKKSCLVNIRRAVEALFDF